MLMLHLWSIPKYRIQRARVWVLMTGFSRFPPGLTSVSRLHFRQPVRVDWEPTQLPPGAIRATPFQFATNVFVLQLRCSLRSGVIATAVDTGVPASTCDRWGRPGENCRTGGLEPLPSGSRPSLNTSSPNPPGGMTGRVSDDPAPAEPNVCRT